MSEDKTIPEDIKADIQKRRDNIRQYFASVGESEIIDELCHCDNLRSEHADDNPIVQGHGHCLLCDCPQFTWKSFVHAPKTPRMAFFVMETRMNCKGEYIALIAIEGERGFYTTDWYWGKDFALAEECAKERNARLGLTEKEAAKIVCSTMKGIKMPEADPEDEPDDHALEVHMGVNKPEVWTTFDITTIPDTDLADIVMRTNDDDDDGIPGELTFWRKRVSIEIAKALAGVSRTGLYGQPVTVTLNGEKI
ncbi:MAG: hypothetical protein PHO67_07870 [Candidatus Omnitrophica bacterium]|nr:hypothetical protein [Candidatus Omnitrophota bacterium]